MPPQRYISYTYLQCGTDRSVPGCPTAWTVLLGVIVAVQLDPSGMELFRLDQKLTFLYCSLGTVPLKTLNPTSLQTVWINPLNTITAIVNHTNTHIKFLILIESVLWDQIIPVWLWIFFYGNDTPPVKSDSDSLYVYDGIGAVHLAANWWKQSPVASWRNITQGSICIVGHV